MVMCEGRVNGSDTTCLSPGCVGLDHSPMRNKNTLILSWRFNWLSWLSLLNFGFLFSNHVLWDMLAICRSHVVIAQWYMWYFTIKKKSLAVNNIYYVCGFLIVCVCESICVCLCLREWDREREREGNCSCLCIYVHPFMGSRPQRVTGYQGLSYRLLKEKRACNCHTVLCT